MPDIGHILNNIKQLNEVSILVKVLERDDVEKFIVKLNTDQLSFGLDSTGDVFGLYRSNSYASFKQGLSFRKASFGVVDLRLTGEYYRSFIVQVFANGDFVIDSNPLTPDGGNLIEKYGADIEGLTGESFDKFIDFILPLFIDETKKEIFQ